MEILHVYKDYFPPVTGGIEKNINLICRHLKQQGISVKVLIANRSGNTEKEVIEGIEVIKAGQWGRFMSAPLTPSFYRFIKNNPADIYHFHHPNPTAELAYLQAGCPGKLVVTYHSDIVRQSFILPFYKPFLYRFLGHAAKILVTSPNYLESSPILRDFKDKCVIVPLGIETDKYQLTPDQTKQASDIRSRYPAKLLVLFVGRLRYYKGLAVLINALSKVSDVELMVIGTAPKPGGEKPYIELVNTLGLQKRIHFLGEVSETDLVMYYHACDVFCLPSIERSEAFGMVQLEAHACAKPVISTRLNTGVPFVNPHQQTGLLVEPNNSDQLADSMNSFLKSPELITQYGQYACQRVNSEFTAQIMVNKVLNIYRQLLSK